MKLVVGLMIIMMAVKVMMIATMREKREKDGNGKEMRRLKTRMMVAAWQARKRCTESTQRKEERIGPQLPSL